MAIYHCSVKVIGRSAGRSAIACAAYRSGEKLYSEETDRTFDYRNKGGVVHSEIALCANAPERFLDRQTLWNSVQSVENKSDSRLAREFELALPLECSKEEWIKIGREYAAYMTEQGMIADWSIHDPVNKETGIQQNPHIHMMCTTRPFKENGEWGAKEKKGYKLDKNGQRIPIIDPKTGQQMIGARGRKMWQRATVDATGWDKKETLKEWREKWAEVVNQHLKPEQHIDHRSYAEQGIELIPTRHEGYEARKLDKELMAEKGIHADVIQKNIEIKQQNELIRALHELIQKLKERAGELYDRYKEQIREHGRLGNILDRVRKGFGILKDGKSGIEYRERKITRIVGEAERREREAVERESAINRASEAISSRADQLKEIETSWRFSGSVGTNLKGIYEDIGQKLISEHSLSIMNEYTRTDWDRYEYDHFFKVQVYIIKPSEAKKADKVLQKKEHLMMPVIYDGKEMVAVICKEDEYYFKDKVKSVAQNFYLYADHKIPEQQKTVQKRPSVAEKIKGVTELSKQREVERTKHKKTTPEPDKDIDNHSL